MHFFVIKLIFLISIFQLSVTVNSENGLLRYKTGIDKIGADVENFLYDIVQDVAKKADSFVNNEYEEFDTAHQNPILANSIKKQESTTSATINVIENYSEEQEERRKRSIDSQKLEDHIAASVEKPEVHQELKGLEDHSIDDIKEELKKLTDLTVILKEQHDLLSVLDKKSKFFNTGVQYNPQDMIQLLEQLEEQRRILKPTKENFKELKHLKTDIQKAIEALNKTSDGMNKEKEKELKLEHEVAQQKEEIEMLKDLVEQLLEKQDSHNNNKKDKKKKKKVIKGQNSTSSSEGEKSSEEDKKSEEDILGVSLFLQPLANKTPIRERESDMKDNKKESKENKDKEQLVNQKSPPVERKDQDQSKKETADIDSKTANSQINAKSVPYEDPKFSSSQSNARSSPYDEPSLHVKKSEARASSLENDISQFLDEMEGNKKPDIEEQLKQLEEKFIKQSREEKISRELARLRTLLGKNSDDEKAGSKKSQQSDGAEFMKKLETLMKLQERNEGREGKVEEKPSDPIREELDKLQTAINNLKPKEDVHRKIEEKPSDSIQEELNKLQTAINNLKPKEDVPKSKVLTKPVAQAKELPDDVRIDEGAVLQLSTDQLRQLRNKIDEILRLQEASAKHSMIPEISSKALLNPIIDTKKAAPYPSWYKGPMSEPCLPYDYPGRPFNNPHNLPFLPPPPPSHGLKQLGDNEIPPHFSDNGPSSILDRSPTDKDIRSSFFQRDRSVPEYNYGLEGPDRYFSPPQDYYPMPINYDMNIPPYNGPYDEQPGINKLEQEIKELKAMISSINQNKTPKPNYSPETQSHPKRYKRSLDQSEASRHERSPDVSSNPSELQIFDDVTSKLREYFMEDNSKGRTAADTRSTGFNEISNSLNKLQSQLEESIHRTNEKVFPLMKYQEPSYYYSSPPKKIHPPMFLFPEIKKDDILANIIVKIIEKGLAIFPQILGKLFGMGVYTLFDGVEKNYDSYTSHDNGYGQDYKKGYGNSYKQGYGKDYKQGYGSSYNQGYGVSYSKDDDLIAIFSKLGVFGYIPLICLNIIKVITAACKLIRKNKIFTNFIVPTVVLLLVAGSIIFLTWWLQPDKDLFEEKLIGFDNSRSRSADPYPQYNYNYYGKTGGSTDSYYNNYNQYVPYPLTYYRNPYKYYGYGGTDRGAHRQSSSRSQPMVYFRSYFEDGSRKV